MANGSLHNFSGEDEMLMNYEETLMARSAWYYYCESMTQQQISDRLGITRMSVIKLLDKAKQNGIVRFQIRSESAKRMDIEQRLVERYSLKDCFVVPSPVRIEDTNENIARAASMYISARIPEETFINIGYGDTSSRILNHLAIYAEHALSFVSLTGGVNYYLPNATSGVFHSRLYLIPTPLIASTTEVAEAMKQERSVRDIEDLIPLSFLSVVGIGAMNEDATIIRSGILTQNDFLLLQRNGAVGDILSHFIDEDGNMISTGIDERTISISLSSLRSLNNVIGVAAGLNKINAIRAALKAKYIDTLVTDEDTALAL